jgi:putative ABC transport system permease protein
LLAGIYPAVYTTSFRPAMALSGTFFHIPHHKGMKNMLAGVQYTAAIFLIVTTGFIKLQYDYLQNKDWGIQTENILYFNTMPNRMNVDNAMIELSRNPNIIDVTAAAHFPGQEGIMRWGRMIDSIRVSMTAWPVKPDFFDFFGIQVVEGERFKVNDSEKMILNRAFLKEYNLSDILRKDISDYEVIGIVKDFNFNSLRENIRPLAFVPIDDKNKGRYYNWIFVKTQGTNTGQTMEYIRDTWKKFSDEPAEVFLLNETIQSLYQREYNLASLVSICGMIAIAVAMTGLYGLTLFDSKAQRRNIAIRKVHGASKTDVLLLLNQSRLLQFAVSCLVAFPLSYYAVQRWLENFAYKTPVYWWVFLLGGLAVLTLSLLTVSWESYKAASANPAEVLKT